MKKLITLIAIVSITLTVTGQTKTNPNAVSTVHHSNLPMQIKTLPPKMEKSIGDTLMYMPLINTFVNTTDSVNFSITMEDIDGLPPNNAGFATAFGVYYSTDSTLDGVGSPIATNFYHPWENWANNDTTFFWRATSWFNPAGQANNWLNFGPLTIPLTGATLKWYDKTQGAYRDGYKIFVSTTPSTILTFSDFIDPPIYTRLDEYPSSTYTTDTTWVLRTVTLPPIYNGQVVSIAFNHDANNMDVLSLDEITLVEGGGALQGVSGYTYNDNNSNCVLDAGDAGITNIHIKQYDNVGTLTAQQNTYSLGGYYFNSPPGTYTVAVDTLGMPYTVSCTYPGIDTTLTTSPFMDSVNFAVVCKPGFDLGVQSILHQGIVFPGQQHVLSINAGDFSQWYNFNCGSGVAGTVVITVTGPVTYTTSYGALTPSVAGNVFTYNVADFGAINNNSAFHLGFLTNSSAIAGNTVCVNVVVTATSAIESYTYNNTSSTCYYVVNSYDPNVKETYPTDVLPNYNDYFTYTVHFQNTGSAPAFNINVKDTLSPLLDLNTFQLINYSHPNTTTLTGNKLLVSFSNIMLQDSTTNEAASHGYFQYRIKPLSNLPNGTQIHNTASIYFDFNAPVVTNTTTNNFTLAGINENQFDLGLTISPNPFNSLTTLSFLTTQHNTTLKIMDVLGKEVFHSIINGMQSIIDLNYLSKGIYFVEVVTSDLLTTRKKIIKE